MPDHSMNESNRVKILRASAGSGKTYRLAYEYIKSVVTYPRSYSSILAVTFTNKATEEMKSRILAELNSLAEGKDSPYIENLKEATGYSDEKVRKNATLARSLILHDYSHFAISTIDKFFQKIVRGFIKELGLDFGYTVELNDDAYLGEAVDRLIEKTATNEFLSRLTGRVLGENLDNARNWDIRPELAEIAKELTKESYRPSTRNPEELIAQYESIRKLVATQQAELKQECDAVEDTMKIYGLQPTDFKGSSSSFATLFVKIGNGEDVFERMYRLEKVAESAEEWYSKTSDRKNDIIAAIPQLMAHTRKVIDLYDNYIILKNSFDLLSENFNKTLLLEYINEELQNLWVERNRIPIHQTTKLINRLVENTAVPFIYEKAGNRFNRYMIDEFQDTSAAQWKNFLPLLDDAVANAEDESVMLIGDIKQAIYRWRGGDWDILAKGALAHYGEEADESEQLNTNWRSLPEVINFNNELIRAVVNTSENPILDRVYEDFEQKVPTHKIGGYVRVAGIESEELEPTLLETVADAITRGYRRKDIAVLVRNKRHGREAANFLLSAGHSIIDQESLLLVNSKVVGIIVSLLRYALNREDMVSLAKFNHLSGRDFTEPFGNSEFLDSLLLKIPTEAVDAIIMEFSLGEQSDQFSYLQAFYQVVMTYSTENVPDLRGFIEWWDEKGDKKSVYLPSSGDSITILTIHKSKGLQFPCVIIPHCEWELEPARVWGKAATIWANTDESLFELFNPAPLNYKSTMEQSFYIDAYVHEKVYSLIDAVNLLYVAATRAERELYIFYEQKLKVEKTGSMKKSVKSRSIASLVVDSGFGECERGTKERFTPKAEESVEQISFDRFIISPSNQKIRTSWDSQRYYEDGQRIETPISYGVLMHQIFSQIGTVDDIESAIRAMVASGELNIERSIELRGRIEKALSDPTVASWFAPHWKTYNENAILLPNSTATKRPDRVVTDDDKAIVIDYKFGSAQKNNYISQVNDYKSLLNEMGYSDVKGYLWYVELEQIVEV